MRVTVLAATGQLGQALLRRLEADPDVSVVAVGRDPAKLAALGGVESRAADLDDPAALKAALADAEIVVSCTNARFVPAILAALPESGVRRLVMMGSTRCFSKVPDATATAVREAEAALAACPVPSVLLLATMIYGGGIGVVESLARQMRRFPLLPLPGAGTLVQPIHVEDAAACLALALTRPEVPGAPIVVAGPQAMPYREMVRAVAAARGLRATVVPLPSWAVRAAAGSARRIGRLRGAAGSLLRLLEDKAFDIAAMREQLGVEPRGFAPKRSG
jgi:uncharacterized protein YbjT (DUF2867 family)